MGTFERLKKLKKIMGETYKVDNVTITVECSNEKINGFMYGDDECFENGKFYQYLQIAASCIRHITKYLRIKSWIVLTMKSLLQSIRKMLNIGSIM